MSKNKNIEIFKIIQEVVGATIKKRENKNEILDLFVKDKHHCLLKVSINLVKFFFN